MQLLDFGENLSARWLCGARLWGERNSCPYITARRKTQRDRRGESRDQQRESGWCLSGGLRGGDQWCGRSRSTGSASVPFRDELVHKGRLP